MNISFEEFYFNYHKLLKNEPILDLGIFQKMGLVHIFQNKIILIKVKKPNKLNLYFYYANFNKLNNLLDENDNVKFFIHYILFNIHTYTSVEKLVKIIEKNNNIIVDKNEVNSAHNILLQCGLFTKEYCFDNVIHQDYDGTIISIKNMWFYRNEGEIDYFGKLYKYYI